jgi:2-polyprenyl-3-methyl-5-hydroxy-6-metoxy-1,4-benzoquinol methylase
MAQRTRAVLQKILRRTWMKYALRGVGPNDNFERLDLAYSIEDPWNMDSPGETARFEATNRIIAREFGALDSVLELGCGEGHQSAWLARVATRVYGVDVSDKAVERARQRVPGGTFAAADIFSQPWADSVPRFDLVTACEVLYYLSDVERTLARMSQLGRHCLVTIFAPAARRVGPHLERIPGLRKDWIWHGGTVWLVCWWRND